MTDVRPSVEATESDQEDPVTIDLDAPAATPAFSRRGPYAIVTAGALAVITMLVLSLTASGGDPVQSVRSVTGAAPADDAPEPTTPRAVESALLLPDLQALPPESLSVESDPGAGTRKIRFSTTSTNLGDGPLEMRGTLDPETGRTRATQRIARGDGDGVVERVAGDFVFHPTHRHWHFESFTDFALWTYLPGGALDRVVATTGKMTFCVMDTGRADGAPTGDQPRAFTGCGNSTQGISVGWHDTYGSSIPGQELDVSGLPDGRYAIRSTVDPENRLMEIDDTNNATVAYVQLSGSAVERLATP